MADHNGPSGWAIFIIIVVIAVVIGGVGWILYVYYLSPQPHPQPLI